MSKTTQCERVLEYIKEFGGITQIEALRDIGCMRLASRIADLKGQGCDIVSERTKGKNRYGEQTSYCTYRLANKEVNINA